MMLKLWDVIKLNSFNDILVNIIKRGIYTATVSWASWNEYRI